MLDQSITFSMARIKLRQRHLLEFDNLSASQHMFLKLIREENVKKLTVLIPGTRTYIDLMYEQTAHSIDLMAHHQEEHAKMKVRHRQEKNDLEQILNTPK